MICLLDSSVVIAALLAGASTHSAERLYTLDPSDFLALYRSGDPEITVP
jgi:hypothetical protein